MVRPEIWRNAGKFQASARKLRRSASGASPGIVRSTSSCVLFHTGSARASRLRPFMVSFKMRLRPSAGSGTILTNPPRSSGFKAAVKVVRSIPSNPATGTIPGGSGRFSDISSENCPLVSPNGRSASSNRRANARAARCTCKHRQQSRTINVASYGSAFTLDTAPY